MLKTLSRLYNAFESAGSWSRLLGMGAGGLALSAEQFLTESGLNGSAATAVIKKADYGSGSSTSSSTKLRPFLSTESHTRTEVPFGLYSCRW